MRPQVGSRGRPAAGRPKLDEHLVVLVTREQREQLVEEARTLGYASLAAYIREHKLVTASARA